MHYWNLLVCRQPELTAKDSLTDGKGFAVSELSAKVSAKILSAITFFADSQSSTDGKDFAISLVARADGKEKWRQRRRPSSVRRLTVGFAHSRSKADGKASPLCPQPQQS